MDPHFQPDDLPEYDVRHRHHVNWCREWRIDRLFEVGDDEPSVTHSDLVANPSQNPLFATPAFDTDASGFQPGSIRLLSSSVTGDSGRPTYILLIGEWDNGWSWFMPFSIYTAPATDWELLSKLDASPLQVLQIWNARSCPDQILERSWYVTGSGAALVKEARVLYSRMVSGGDSLPLDLATRVGTRVLDSNDSRMGYLQAESARLDHLTELALQHEAAESAEEPDNVVPFLVSLPAKESRLVLAAAAESPDRELVFHVWLVVGTGIHVHLMELLEISGAYTLRVEDDVDELLEGAKVFDGPVDVLAEIHAGHAGSKSNPLRINTHSLAIQLTDGQFLRLGQVDEKP